MSEAKRGKKSGQIQQFFALKTPIFRALHGFCLIFAYPVAFLYNPRPTCSALIALVRSLP